MQDSEFLGPSATPPEKAHACQTGEKYYLIGSGHWYMGAMCSVTGKQIDSTALIYNTKLWTLVP